MSDCRDRRMRQQPQQDFIQRHRRCGRPVGAEEMASGKAKEISGITTPDDQTLVIKLNRPVAPIVIGAMALPGTAPVPKEYAAKFDAGKKSDYGPHLVTTGPYMIPNDASGK